MNSYVLTLAVVLPPLLLIDFLAFGRTARSIGISTAIAWSIGWVVAALTFAVIVALTVDTHSAGLFLSTYVLEKSLSVDNLIVFAAVLGASSVRGADRMRVLTWGITLALVFRAVLLAAGWAFLHVTVHANIALGALLVGAGIAMTRAQLIDGDEELTQQRVRHRGGVVGVLSTIAVADAMFALDSVPAAFAVTTNPAIVFSANIFALLGLRALYFVVADALSRMPAVQWALAGALVLVGTRLALADVLHVPHWSTPLATALLVTGAVAYSVLDGRRSSIRDTLDRATEPAGVPQ